MLLDCLKKLGKGINSADRSQLEDLVNQHTSAGLSEYDADIAALTDYHKGLFDSANELRTAAKLPPAEYQAFNPEPIRAKYQPAAAPPVPTEPATPEPSVVPPTEAAQPVKETTATPPTTGIAQRVQERMASEGRVPEYQAGEGLSPQELVQRGRDLKAQGTDPVNHLAMMEKRGGAVSADDMALLRAHHADLAKATNEAADKFGTDSSQYKAAQKAETDWYNKISRYRTESSNIFKAQQGETEIDTGTFHGLQRAVGRDLTPAETVKAKQLSGSYSQADQGVKNAQSKLVDILNRATGIKDLPDDVQSAMQKFVTQSQREVRRAGRQATKQSLDAEFADLKAQFAQIKTQQGAGAFFKSEKGALDPQAVDVIIKMAKNRVKAGTTDVAQLIDDIHSNIKDFTDVTKREVAEAITGIGKAPREAREPSEWTQAKQRINARLKAEDAAVATEAMRGRARAGKLTPEDGKAIWQHMRERYIDKGAEFDAALQKTAKELGADPAQVRDAIVNRPRVKAISDEMYRQMSNRRRADAVAKAWVRDVDAGAAVKTLRGIRDAFFLTRIGGGLHGAAGLVTHAGENIFHPTRWADYLTNVGRTWKAIGSKAAHEEYMSDLVNDPFYIPARRGGLANEPRAVYDDYQNPMIQKFLGRIGASGNRGFDILKRMRQDFFNARWEKLDPEQRTPEMAQAISDIVNHSTGAVKSRAAHSELARTAMFAPPLEASRWARIIGDPARAANTYAKMATGANVTPAERYFAKETVKNAAGFMGTYLSALALNQAVLKLSGSDDHVNFTDPAKGDFLRFKVKGRAIEPTGGLIATTTFIARLLNPAMNPIRRAFGREPVLPRQGETVGSQTGETAYKYGRGKLSPVASLGEDVRTGEDYSGRPVPWSSEEKGKYGEPRASWKEYLLTQQTPIPVSIGARDIFQTLHDQGAPSSAINAILKGVAIGTFSGATGIHVGEEFKPREAAGRGRTRSRRR